MKIVELDGKMYKDPTGLGLELIPVEQNTMEEVMDSVLEKEEYRAEEERTKGICGLRF